MVRQWLAQLALVVSVLVLGGSLAVAQETAPQAAADAAAPADAQVAQEAAPAPVPATPLESDGPSFPVTEVVISYSAEHPSLVGIRDLMQVEIPLGITEQGYVAPRPGLAIQRVRLADLPQLEQHTFYASAIRQISVSLSSFFKQRGLIGVYVAPSEQDIDTTGKDLRTGGNTALNIGIHPALVTGMRTLAAGERVPQEDRINNPVHARIIENSPVRPDGVNGTTPLPRQDLIDNYVLRLNRHPGRRVDVAVTPAEDGLSIDYLVSENKPWLAYFQISNTGTEQTDEWRQRFGFVHNQLTNNDDILAIDYTTTWFDEVHAISASYEAPWSDSELLRWRVFGGYSQFRASEVGVVGERFEGSSYQVGADLIYNVYQHRELFVDVVGGVRFQHIEIDNTTLANPGDNDFFLPHVGLQLERQTQTQSTRAAVDIEFNVDAISATTEGNATHNLGRLFTDDDFAILTWDASHSFYLEPLLNRAAWEDPSTPESSTLAHEINLAVRGQYSFDTRLVPQHQQVVGGMFSVRGYPESVSAGDFVTIATAEYRFHLPRTFAIVSDPATTPLFGQPFRYAPQRVYGMPDWDLVLKAFVDAGVTVQSDRIKAFEDDEFLLGAGVGIELLFKRNVSLRADWGFALHSLQNDEVTAGSSQVHILATILY